MTNTDYASKLDLNLDQWRQDIQTFVASTKNELDDITDQLSSSLAGGPSQSGTNSGRLPTSSPQQIADRTATDQTANANAAKADDRIGKLKQQLAAKLKSTNKQ